MSRRDGKEIEGVGSGQSSARDDEVEYLRIKLQRLERSLQEEEDTIKELRGRQYHPRNRHYEDEWEDDTPPHPREVGRFRWRGRDHHEEHSNFSPKIDIPEFEGKSNVDDFLEWLNTVERVF